MNKKEFKKVELGKGEVNIFSSKTMKLHAYKTNDFMRDEVFVVEKNGKAVIIEAPCFYDNNFELEKYLTDIQVEVVGKLLSYHMAGGTFLPKVPTYSTGKAEAYGKSGGGAALIKNFVSAFGDSFDSTFCQINNIINYGKENIGGIDFEIIETNDAFDIALPEINAIYTHMLGHDCHSIVAGNGHADAIIAQLNEYSSKKFDLVLTSHYEPEDLKDIATKIAYINDLKKIALCCKTSDEFKAKVKEKYPKYCGDNYLEMTAGFFFA